MSATPNGYPETGIETATPYYQGWVSFTRFATYGIISLVVLLSLMALFLV